MADGQRYVMFPTASGFILWDAVARPRQAIDAPPDCTILDGHRSRFLLSCGQEPRPALMIVNARSARVASTKFELNGADYYNAIGR